ncbi:cytochrome b558/566 subunit A [Sulfolobales archaeon HS-7]|nr:cytochrome b558/566 subunit A [Sulfolobales archaeon HS-7]
MVAFNRRINLIVTLIAFVLILIGGLLVEGLTAPQIIAYKVSGSADLGAPGSEPFWRNIPWTNVTLAPNLKGVPTSGETHWVEVKMAYNGTDMFVLMRWYSPEPAFNAWSAAAAALNSSATGIGLFRIIELEPNTTYKILNNYTNYTAIVNGKTYQGRLEVMHEGVSILFPNSTQITVSNNTILLYHSPRPIEAILYSSGLFYGYYTNQTWYYPDRAAIMWYMGNETEPMDAMNVGGKYPGQIFDGFNFSEAGGSLSAGPANIWMWVSGATWNSTLNPAFKYNLWQNTSLTGLNYTTDHGFAVPLFTNQTDMYEVDTSGIWYSPVASSGLNGSLFMIWTGANYSNGYWTVEFVRSMTVSPHESKFMPTFKVGQEYNVAFAIWQGREGETLFDKSIAPEFLTVFISPQEATALNPLTFYIMIVAGVIAILVLILLQTIFKK